MAINVHYQPPMEMISQAAYRAGLGQFNQRQQQIALQQQEAEANRMMRERQLALQANAQQFEMQRAAQLEMLRRDQMEQEAGFKAQELDLANRRQQAYMQQLASNSPETRQRFQWDRDTAVNADRQVSSLQARLSKMKLNDIGQEKMAALNSELRMIQSKRPQMRQEAYSQAIGQWMQKVEDASLHDYVVEPPTADDVIANNMRNIDAHNALIVDSDGKYKIVRLQPPPKPTSKVSVIDDTTNAPLPFDQFVKQNYDTYVKMRDAARKELIEEAKLKQGDSLTVTPPTASQIMARVREKYEDDMRAMSGDDGSGVRMIDPMSMLRPEEGPQQMPATAQAAQNPANAQPTKRWRVLPDGTMQEIK